MRGPTLMPASMRALCHNLSKKFFTLTPKNKNNTVRTDEPTPGTLWHQLVIVVPLSPTSSDGSTILWRAQIGRRPPPSSFFFFFFFLTPLRVATRLGPDEPGW